VRMTKSQIAGRTGPLRQIRRRDEVVSPLALELGCRGLLHRAQRAIATVVTSQAYEGELHSAVDERVLRRHEWEIAVALREISELLLDLASSYAGGRAGPMTTAMLVSQNRAISLARDATTARVLSLEILAAQVAAAGAARPPPPGLGHRGPDGGRQRQVPRSGGPHGGRPARHHGNRRPRGAGGRGRAGTARDPAAGHPGGRGPSPPGAPLVQPRCVPPSPQHTR